jgi:hypothetical protein
MKLTKLAFAGVVAALAVWTSNAQIIPGGYYQFEKINFKLVVQQQDLVHANTGSGFVWTVKTMKMGNKEMLRYMAEAFHMEWPAGAQLAMLRDTRDFYPVHHELYVLDKDGQPVWSGNMGYYLNETNAAYLRVNCGFALKAGKDEYKWPVETYKVTNTRIISFWFFRTEDADPSVSTDLTIQGVDTDKIQFRVDNSKYTSSKSLSEHASVSGAGMMNGAWTVISGSVAIAGKSKDNL